MAIPIKYDYTRAADVAYIEQLYTTYQADPSAVDPSWVPFFQAYEFFLQTDAADGAVASGTSSTSSGSSERTGTTEIAAEGKVQALIDGYRSRGHLSADTNPIRRRRDHDPRLDIKYFDLPAEALQASFTTGASLLGQKTATLQEIIGRLTQLYGGKIGFDYMHMRDPVAIEWFRKQAEEKLPTFRYNVEEKKHVLSKLNQAVVFESFLHTKYVGQKRFSLEGGETMIPALDALIQYGATQGVDRVVIGMAHRGRLNVLANIMNKTYEEIFHEFEGTPISEEQQMMGDGDVKYHMGYSSRVDTLSGKKVDLSLAPNPSHLEAVDGVVQGWVRAKIDSEYANPRHILPVLIHGDAALAGQGLVFEIAQMSRLDAYSTGGTVHLVINNQVGFTTDYHEARSSIYCADVAKAVDAPVLHVNGDDPEAVVFCMRLALDFRQRFSQDVYVDMVCYRRHGHNESDEPKFTQPLLYNIIAKHPNPREIYSRRLAERGEVDAQVAQDLDKQFRSLLQDRLKLVKEQTGPRYLLSPLEKEWTSLRHSTPKDFLQQPATGTNQAHIDQVAAALVTLPTGFKPLRQIEKIITQRKAMFSTEKQLNWASAELLAYGTLLLEGNTVRVSGQDTQRGTFSHRHAVLRDAQTNVSHNSLAPLVQEGRTFALYNSLLSEYGALGFEFGYSWANSNALVVWEAQFGDFANGAQVIIDQFIATSYTKWQRMSGLVLLLPHGYEGQGPEHSNARPERYLQLCSGNNMFVCNLTTPANFFHLLRRQLALPFRMPCVVMSPKSLFRHPKVVSPVSDFIEGSFVPFIDDNEVDKKVVRKVLLCTGKVYYELLAARETQQIEDVAILRIEQLHPFPTQVVSAAIARYKQRKVVAWVQEEPQNMGYWTYLLRVFAEGDLVYIGRKAAASPATGFYKTHQEQQNQLITQALA